MSMSDLLLQELGEEYPLKVANVFYRHMAQPETITNPESSLISAKISSLIARTSCATFFSSPEVSGKINLLYAFQSILYLQDAGFNLKAQELKRKFFEKLADVNYPGGHKTALSELEKMLGM